MFQSQKVKENKKSSSLNHIFNPESVLYKSNFSSFEILCKKVKGLINPKVISILLSKDFLREGGNKVFGQSFKILLPFFFFFLLLFQEFASAFVILRVHYIKCY